MADSLNKFCVEVSSTLLDAMRAIDRGAARIALVVEEDNRLLGTLSDGDIRRAILDGAHLDAAIGPYINKDCLSVGPDAGRAEVLDLMQAHLVDQIPVLDTNRRLLGMHLLHGLLGATERPNWAVIMAGGKGTRLRPITEHLPKPMVKVAGRPILERLILHLISYGIKRIFLSTNYLAHMIEDYFGDGASLGCKIEYLRENEPLGTGGALSMLPDKPSHPLLVMNGDLVMQANLEKMLNFHSSGNYYATMGVSNYHHEIPYGCVSSDDSGCIVSLEEKPVSSYLVNAGIYVLSPEAVADIPSQFYPVTRLFETALEDAKPCGCFSIEEDWADVGQIGDLKKALGIN